MKNAPDLKAAEQAFAAFCSTIAALRDPKTGCPWDLKQSHATLRKYMIEEAYEAAEAMSLGDVHHLKDELGDVLLQVVLNAQIALDEKTFSIVDVIRSIDDKMRRRHPHVFGAGGREPGMTSDQVLDNWEIIKANEKAKGDGRPESGSFFADAHGTGPATHQALKIGKIAAKIRFDWERPEEVLAQVRSEIDEVTEALKQGERPAALAEEIGDVYFSLAQLCRHLDFDPEMVSLDANRKFLKRFAAVEKLAASRGQDVPRASRDELETLWRDVKNGER